MRALALSDAVFRIILPFSMPTTAQVSTAIPICRRGYWCPASVRLQAVAHSRGGCRSSSGCWNPLWQFLWRGAETSASGRVSLLWRGGEGRGESMITLKTLSQGLVVLRLDAVQTPMCFQEVALNTHKKCCSLWVTRIDGLWHGPFKFHFVLLLGLFFPFPAIHPPHPSTNPAWQCVYAARKQFSFFLWTKWGHLLGWRKHQ